MISVTKLGIVCEQINKFEHRKNGIKKICVRKKSKGRRIKKINQLKDINCFTIILW